MSFSIQRNHASLTVTVAGASVIGGAHRAMKEDVIEAIRQGARHIAIRLHGVQFLDSDALGMLVSIRKKAREAGGSVTLAGLSTGVHTLFDCTRLAVLFTIIDSEPSTWQRGVLSDEPGEYARVDGRSAR